MPILPVEPAMYPPDLWSRDDQVAVPGRRSWCLHTRPRQEKATARHLHSRGITYYLPQVVQEGRTPGGRKTRSTVPLFASSLFCHGDDAQRVEALQGNRL